jgi:hypothetical protein
VSNDPTFHAIQREAKELEQSASPEDQARFEALNKLYAFDRGLDAFRAACTPVAFTWKGEGWTFADPAQHAIIRDGLPKSAELSEEEQEERFGGLLSHIDHTFQTTRQPVMPLLSLKDAKWILFYKDTSFGAQRRRGINGMGLYQASSVQDVLGILSEEKHPNDPVAWYFDALKRQHGAN